MNLHSAFSVSRENAVQCIKQEMLRMGGILHHLANISLTIFLWFSVLKAFLIFDLFKNLTVALGGEIAIALL